MLRNVSYFIIILSFRQLSWPWLNAYLTSQPKGVRPLV